MADQQRETRAFLDPQLRIDVQADAKPVIRGHAAVYDQLSEDLGGFRERIAKGAFVNIQHSDVRALINHDANMILGRSVAGTLRLAEDDTGLAIEIDPPDTHYARDLGVSLERGDITGMSFGFYTIKDDWRKIAADWVRTLLEIELFDVSVVTWPAYPQTDVALRALAMARSGDVPPDIGLLARMRRRLALIS